MKDQLLKLSIGIVLFFGILTMPARADLGFAIGVSGTAADFSTSGTEEESWGASSKGIDINTTTVENSVDFGAVFMEFAGKNDWGGITVGFEWIPGEASLGAKSRTDSDGDTSDDADTGVYSAKAEVSNHVQFYLEPTVYATDGIGFYLKGGLNHVTVKSLESLQGGTDKSAYGDDKIWGGTLGAGIRLKAPFGLLLKAEYTHTEYETVVLKSATGNKNRIKADPESDNIRLALGWQF